MSRNGNPEPEQRLPLFLADEAIEQHGLRNALSRSAISSRVLKAIAWAAVPGALGIALLSAEAPFGFFAELTSSISDTLGSTVGPPPLKSVADRATPVIRYASADADPVPSVVGDAPALEQISAAPEPVDRRQAANGEAGTEGLLGQFQAWAADKEPQAPVELAQPVPEASPQAVPDVPAKVAQEAPAQMKADDRESARPSQKRRHTRTLRNAHAEMQHAAPHRRKKTIREQDARVSDQPPQEVRRQEPALPAQPAQPQGFFQTLGWPVQPQ